MKMIDQVTLYSLCLMCVLKEVPVRIFEEIRFIWKKARFITNLAEQILDIGEVIFIKFDTDNVVFPKALRSADFDISGKYGTDFVNACLLLVLQIIDFNKISLSNHSIKIDRGQSIRMELVIVLSAMKIAS